MSPSKPFILFFKAIRHAQPIYTKLQDVAHTEVITTKSRTEFFHDLQTKYKNIFAIYRTSANGAVAGTFDAEFIHPLPPSCKYIRSLQGSHQGFAVYTTIRPPTNPWLPRPTHPSSATSSPKSPLPAPQPSPASSPTNLVTSTVTVAAATLQQARVFQPARLFGVTTLDVVRAFVFTGQALSTDPTRLRVPVIGGHSGATIVPLYSQAQPPIHAEEATLAGLVHRVQFGGDETVTSKQGAGSATTCMAYAGLRFVKAVLAGSRGEDVTEEAFVYVPGSEGGREMAEELGVEYFVVRTVLGPESPFGDVDGKEREMVEVAVRELRTNVAIGLGYMR